MINQYEKQLTNSAISYLASRGISKQTIKEFHIGEALDYWHEKNNLDDKPFKKSKKMEKILTVSNLKETPFLLIE
jgi:DNA primase